MIAKKPRLKDKLRIGQTITHKRSGATLTIKQIWRKDRQVHVVYLTPPTNGDKLPHDDTVLGFDTLRQFYYCPDWNVLYV